MSGMRFVRDATCPDSGTSNEHVNVRTDGCTDPNRIWTPTERKLIESNDILLNLSFQIISSKPNEYKTKE